ncbi:hypothetical protein D3C80_1608630 [compost metagenome]
MILTVNRHLSARGRQETGNQIEQGAFARPTGAEDRDHFTLLRGQGKTHRQVLVKPGYISQF